MHFQRLFHMAKVLRKSSIKHNLFPLHFHLEPKEDRYACACEEDEGMVYFEDKYGQHCYCVFVDVRELEILYLLV